jgi:hypothetical protein
VNQLGAMPLGADTAHHYRVTIRRIQRGRCTDSTARVIAYTADDAITQAELAYCRTEVWYENGVETHPFVVGVAPYTHPEGS